MGGTFTVVEEEFLLVCFGKFDLISGKNSKTNVDNKRPSVVKAPFVTFLTSISMTLTGASFRSKNESIFPDRHPQVQKRCGGGTEA